MQSQPTSPRFNIYTLIHKGLRAALCQCLVDLGKLDHSDTLAVSQQMDITASLLDFCRSHLQHENDFIHAPLQALGHPQLQTQDDHVQHEREIAELHYLVMEARQAPEPARNQALADLYGHFSLFVAENFSHMRVEETHNSQLLWQHYSDEEIQAIEQRIVASLTPEENLRSLLMMIPNINHSERLALLQGFRQAVPDEIFSATLALFKPLLSPKDWQKLNQALAIPETQAA